LIVASRHGDEDRRSITAALSGAHPGDLKIKTDADNRTAQATYHALGFERTSYLVMEKHPK